MFDRLRENVEVHTLDNGLRVILYKRGIAPIFAGYVSVRVGGVDERVGESGISHLLEHMAFKGTSDIGTTDFGKEKKMLARLEELAPARAEKLLSEDELQEWDSLHTALEKIWDNGAFMRMYRERGAQGMNATTGIELTNYMTSLPSSQLEFWCLMESERILDPVFRQFYQEVDVVHEERRLRYDNSPNGQMYWGIMKNAFTVHPYRNLIIGYPFDLDRHTATQTYDFHKKYYVPSNIVVSLVGGFDTKEALAFVSKYFGRIKPGADPVRRHEVEPPQSGEKSVSLNFDASKALAIAYRKPQFPDPDDPPLGILAELIAGSKLSPLYKGLVEGPALATAVAAYDSPSGRDPNLLLFDISPKDNVSYKRVTDTFDVIVEKFIAQPPSSHRLESAKRKLSLSYLGSLTSNMGLASTFSGSTHTFGRWDAVLDWYEAAMKVTPEDVQRVGRKYLKKDSRTIVTLKGGKDR